MAAVVERRGKILRALSENVSNATRSGTSTLTGHKIVFLPRRCMGRGGLMAWPPRSPDITLLDFILCRYIKDTGYVTNVADPQILHQHIMDGVATVTPEMLTCTSWGIIFTFIFFVSPVGAHRDVLTSFYKLGKFLFLQWICSIISCFLKSTFQNMHCWCRRPMSCK